MTPKNAKVRTFGSWIAQSEANGVPDKVIEEALEVHQRLFAAAVIAKDVYPKASEQMVISVFQQLGRIAEVHAAMLKRDVELITLMGILRTPLQTEPPPAQGGTEPKPRAKKASLAPAALTQAPSLPPPSTTREPKRSRAAKFL